MDTFKKPSMLRKTALSTIVKLMTPEEIAKLRWAFKDADTDNSGTIEKEEWI